MEHLTGKVAFITGGASGIGLGMARAFLEEGMKVSLADWNDAHIAKARERLAGNNAVHFVKTNVAERESLRAAAAETLEAFGKIHVLCNNAGVNGGGTAASEDFDDWDRAIAVNLGGVVNGTKIIAPIIRKQGEGGHRRLFDRQVRGARVLGKPQDAARQGCDRGFVPVPRRHAHRAGAGAGGRPRAHQGGRRAAVPQGPVGGDARGDRPV